jgi:hypothetical protein
MIIKITLSHEDTRAEDDLAGIPNGSCTSGFGCRWLCKHGLNHYFFLNKASKSVQNSIKNNFRDIFFLGKPGDVTSVGFVHRCPDGCCDR